MIYKSSPAYSFGKSIKKSDKGLLYKSMLITPKIGAYKTEILNKPNGGYKFSKLERFKTFRPQTPGPGEYEINNISFGKEVPKYSINKTLRETLINKAIRFSKKNNFPGPCNYTITIENLEKTILPRTLSFFFSKQCKLKNLEESQNKKKEIVEKYLPEVIYKKIIEFLNKNYNNNVEHKANDNKNKKSKKKKKIIDIVYLIDSTYSMGIEAKTASKLVINNSTQLLKNYKNNDYQFGIIFYNDPIDCKTDFNGYFQLTHDINKLKKFCDKWDIQNGEDEAEDWVGGYEIALSEIKWRNGDKIIVHITDSPAHGKKYSKNSGDNHIEESFELQLDNIMERCAKENIRIIGIYKTKCSKECFIECKKIYDISNGKDFIIEYYLSQKSMKKLH